MCIMMTLRAELNNLLNIAGLSSKCHSLTDITISNMLTTLIKLKPLKSWEF